MSENILEYKDLDVERAIISLLVEEKEIREKMTDYHLNSTFFRDKKSADIFDIVLKTIQEGTELDYVLLKEKSAKIISEDELSEFFKFEEFYPKKDLFGDYVKVLHKNHKRNQLLKLIGEAKKAANVRDDQGLASLKKQLEEFDFTVDNDENPEIGLIDNNFLADGIIDFLNNENPETQKTTLYTGYKTIDEGMGGFEKGNYVIFAARPSVGKSVVMINVMEKMKAYGTKVMFFSAEMYARYVIKRIISIHLKIDGDKLKDRRKMSEKEKKAVLEFAETMRNDTDRHIYYSSKMCALDIYQEAKTIKKKYGLDAIFIDYMGKLHPNNGNMNRSRNEIVTDISRELYEIAGALDIVVVTASQLSREGAKTMADGVYVPKLTDLRDSGSIEQDGDIIVGISRDKEAAKHCILESDSTDFNLSFLKNRNGKLGDFTLNYYPTTGRLGDKYEDNPIVISPEKASISEENKLLIDELTKDDNQATLIDNIFN